MIEDIPKFFNVRATLPTDFICKTDSFKRNSAYTYYAAVNIKFGYAKIYYVTDGGGLNTKDIYPLRDSDFGLQFYYDGKWEVFCDEVQKEYAKYLIEKEIK